MKRFLAIFMMMTTIATAQQFASWPAAGSSGGTVTSVTAGSGLTGGTITSSGTIALAIPVTTADGGTGTTTTFTTGSVVFADGSGNYAQDNANFFWDGTNHRLGIGTSVPAQALEVHGASGATNTAVFYGNSGGAGNGALTISGANSNDSAFELDNTGASGHNYNFRSRSNGALEINDLTGGFTVLSGGGSAAGVGIYVEPATASLDVGNGGTIRYRSKYSSGSPPVACSSAVDGLTFLSSTYHLCVCNSTSYVLVSDGSSACS